MVLKVTYSINPDPEAAAKEILLNCSGLDPSAVLFFASSRFNPESISKSMKNAFQKATVIGCSTSGELISGKMLKQSVVAMVCESDTIGDIAVDIINLNEPGSTETILTQLAGKYGKKPLELDPEKYVGIILIDGLSCAEERVMERLSDLTNITVIGGSAGDDLAFKKTWVYADGRVYENSALLAVLKPAVKFDFIKTQSFCSLKKKLTATKVDESTRKVLEFNNKPALVAYSESLGIQKETANSSFMKYPVGLISDNEPYVRSPQRTEGDAMYFYCQIREGMELDILESTNIIEDTKKAITDKQKEVGKILGLINFHCILRTLDLEQQGKTEDYGKIFSDIPMIGFSTYGEEYIGHINQTSTMLIFY